MFAVMVSHVCVWPVVERRLTRGGAREKAAPGENKMPYGSVEEALARAPGLFSITPTGRSKPVKLTRLDLINELARLYDGLVQQGYSAAEAAQRAKATFRRRYTYRNGRWLRKGTTEMGDVNFSAGARLFKAYEEQGEKFLVVDASDSLPDKQGGYDPVTRRFWKADVIAPSFLQKMKDLAAAGKVELVEGHSGAIPLGVSVSVDKSVSHFRPIFKIDQENPVAMYLWEKVRRGELDRQVSIGGRLDPAAVRFRYDPTVGGYVREITNGAIDHVAIVRPGTAANPRTGFVEAIAKALDESAVDYEEALEKLGMDTYDDASPYWDALRLEKAVWTRAYINDLPDECFAVILPGGEKDDEGKTVPRTLRKLPYRDHTGKIDIAHLKNALSRLPQTDLPEDLREKARRVLERAAREAKLPTYVKKEETNMGDAQTPEEGQQQAQLPLSSSGPAVSVEQFAKALEDTLRETLMPELKQAVESNVEKQLTARLRQVERDLQDHLKTLVDQRLMKSTEGEGAAPADGNSEQPAGGDDGDALEKRFAAIEEKLEKVATLLEKAQSPAEDSGDTGDEQQQQNKGADNAGENSNDDSSGENASPAEDSGTEVNKSTDASAKEAEEIARQVVEEYFRKAREQKQQQSSDGDDGDSNKDAPLSKQLEERIRTARPDEQQDVLATVFAAHFSGDEQPRQ